MGESTRAIPGSEVQSGIGQKSNSGCKPTIRQPLRAPGRLMPCLQPRLPRAPASVLDPTTPDSRASIERDDRIRARQRDPDESRAGARRLRRSGPRRAHRLGHRRLGITLLAAGDTAEGERELRKALELGPNDAETLDRLEMLEASRQPLALRLPDTLNLAIDVTDPADPHIGHGRLVLARLGPEGGTAIGFGLSPRTKARRSKYACNARTAW
jgi:hypothetical protein